MRASGRDPIACCVPWMLDECCWPALPCGLFAVEACLSHAAVALPVSLCVCLAVRSWEEVLCLITATKLTGTEWWVALRGRALTLLAETTLRTGRWVDGVLLPPLLSLRAFLRAVLFPVRASNGGDCTARAHHA
jgi:hypothetical protein